ncbi:MAG: carbonic anhydrase [Candidatus Eremiobacteraeota bacterium]|nr:carbonic anhydrase [Candidatus Eremiobacteraeota bacterium]
MAPASAADALKWLKEGNARFVSGEQRFEPKNARVLELAQGQNPYAVVLGCSDSRVPVETIFDADPGHIFVVRVAGNFLNADNLGSIEYGVAVLKSKLILVLGHTKCGAVTAAVDSAKDGIAQPGHIQNLVTAIMPAAEATRHVPGDWLANAVNENVRRNVLAMTAESTVIAGAVESRGVEVAGAVYYIHTGIVHFR